MDGRLRAGRSARRLICFAVVCLAVGAALSPAVAKDKATKVVTADATVVSIAIHRADFCADYGLFRWQAVKGVDSYTLRFNDAAFGGAEQTKIVSEPFEEDIKEAPGSPLNTPAGTHQAGWTGISGSPPCGEPVDYSGRLTNARVEYVREGTYIDGIIKPPSCSGDDCPSVQGIKVTARGETTKSDKTDAKGKYSIKVKKGRYSVVPRQGKLEFDPDSRKVNVGASRSARANFRIHYVPPDPFVVATPVYIRARAGHRPTAEFLRGGTWTRLDDDTQLRVGDRIRTDAFTTVGIEFVIGGRTGIYENSAIKITGEGTTEHPAPAAQLTKGEMWAKCQKLKEPLEIQVSAGVIGIKG